MNATQYPIRYSNQFMNLTLTIYLPLLFRLRIFSLMFGGIMYLLFPNEWAVNVSLTSLF
jgi:hypothetical protein